MISKLVNEGIQNLHVAVNIVCEGPLLEDILRISKNSNKQAPFNRNYSCTSLKTFPFKTFSSLSILTGAATFAFNQFNFLNKNSNRKLQLNAEEKLFCRYLTYVVLSHLLIALS